MKIITSENFESDVLKAENPVILEFYSDSCIPCKRMSPILAEIDEENENITVAKLNIRTGKDIVSEYEVMASPTILFFKDGKEVNRVRGVAKKADLEKIIAEISA